MVACLITAYNTGVDHLYAPGRCILETVILQVRVHPKMKQRMDRWAARAGLTNAGWYRAALAEGSIVMANRLRVIQEGDLPGTGELEDIQEDG